MAQYTHKLILKDGHSAVIEYQPVIYKALNLTPSTTMYHKSINMAGNINRREDNYYAVILNNVYKEYDKIQHPYRATNLKN